MAGVRNIFATKEQLEEKYAEMNSMNKLAKYYGVNVKTVTSLMNYYNIKRNVDSQGARKHFYDESYFETINTEDKAYWLGFIMADGCVYRGSDKHSHRLQINLATKDKNTLEKFQKCINSSYKIQDKIIQQKYEVSLLKINSTKMCLDLISHGVTERKSLRCCFPTSVPNHLISHFIRGYFDGDGCISISNNKPTFNIVGGKEMLVELQKRLHKTNLYILKQRSHIATLEAGSDEAMILIYHYLYDDANIYMQRKKDIFDAAIKCPLVRQRT